MTAERVPRTEDPSYGGARVALLALRGALEDPFGPLGPQPQQFTIAPGEALLTASAAARQLATFPKSTVIKPNPSLTSIKLVIGRDITDSLLVDLRDAGIPFFPDSASFAASLRRHGIADRASTAFCIGGS